MRGEASAGPRGVNDDVNDGVNDGDGARDVGTGHPLVRAARTARRRVEHVAHASPDPQRGVNWTASVRWTLGTVPVPVVAQLAQSGELCTAPLPITSS